MRNGITKFLSALFMAALLTAGMTGTVRAADFVIGVGDGARLHYHVGRALCRVIKRSIQGVSCEALQIEGRDPAEPLAVLNNVRNGTIEIGIVQSDWIHHAFNASGPAKFGDEKYTNLRTMFVLHGEPFTVIARQDARIKKLDDLAGKRVNIGQPRSR
jgi:TRAP transporter TAXI family solute receptor